MKEPSTPSPCFRFEIYVGAPPGSGKLCITDRFAVVQRISSRFPSFFSQEGQGFFQGNWEDCLKVEVATNEVMAVLEAASDIREALGLEAVGICWAGMYQRVFADSEPEKIAGNWKLPSLG